MKKLFFVFALLFSVSALAQHHGHYGYHAHINRPYYSSGYWIAPAIAGGLIGYALAQPRVIYTTPPPPVVVYPPVVSMPVPPVGYHYENILDQNCNCYRLVLVPN